MRITMIYLLISRKPSGPSWKISFPKTRKNDVRSTLAAYPIDQWIAGHTHLYQINPAAPNRRFPLIVLGGGSKKYYESAAFYCKVDSKGIRIEAIDSDGQTTAKFHLDTTDKIPVLVSMGTRNTLK